MQVSIGLRLVPGVEISASWRAQAIHVLGLWIDPASPALRSELNAQGERRRARMRKICERLGKLGLPGAELLAAVAGASRSADARPSGESHGRRRPRRVVPRRRSASTWAPARAPIVAAEWPALETVVGWIRAAGRRGLARSSGALLPVGRTPAGSMLGDFTAAGGAALEVVTGANGAQHVEAVAALAVKYGLMGSVGSDFHDPRTDLESPGPLP